MEKKIITQSNRLTICELDMETATSFLSEEDYAEDFDAFFASLPIEEVAQALMDKKGMDGYFSLLSELKNTTDRRYFGAYLGQTLVGCAGFLKCQSGSPEIQINIARNHQAQGLGTEFLRNLIPELFRSCHFHHITYRARKDNHASNALVKTLGGILQQPKNRMEALVTFVYHIYPYNMILDLKERLE